MRIRKNAKLLKSLLFGSSSAYSSEFVHQPHVCQLNQSPWDVITFPPDSTTSSNPPSSNNQLEGEHSFSGNVSIGDSIGAVESVASMKILSMEGEEAKAMEKNGTVLNLFSSNIDTVKGEKAVDNGEKREMNGTGLKKGESLSYCNKADGKGWQCRREAKEGHSLCEHHLAQLRSYNSLNHTASRKSDKPPPAKPSSGVRRRGRGPGKKPPASNPYEFYYYSGFGPLWGKKRGVRDEGNNSNETKVAVEATIETPSPSPSAQIDDSNENNEEEFDLQDDDDEDDDDDDENRGENGEMGRKRGRKPVKERSLKSLM